MRIKYLLLLLFTPHFAWTQESEKRWVRPHENTLTLSTGVTSTNLGLEWHEKNESAPILFYQTNKQPQIFISAAYRSFSASLSLINLSYQDSPSDVGKTLSTDYQFRFYGNRWTPEFFYQQYRGYYLRNAGTLGVPSSPSYQTYYRDDIKLSHLGSNVYYNLNPANYTLSGNFNLANRQIESGGSWFLIGAYNSYDLQANSPLIPSQLMTYGNSTNIQRIKSDIFSFGGAGAYTFVYNHFFAGLMAGLSLDSVTNKTYLNTGLIENESSSGQRVYLKVSIGYNGPNFFSNLALINDGQTINVLNSHVLYDVSELKLTFGWRFEDMKISHLDHVHDEYLPQLNDTVD